MCHMLLPLSACLAEQTANEVRGKERSLGIRFHSLWFKTRGTRTVQPKPVPSSVVRQAD
jgi:hypothetical protein